jgi:hypothetical protein
MSSYNVAPAIPCPSCSNTSFTPKLNTPQVVISGGGSAGNPWPIKVKGCPEQVGITPDGKPMIARKDVIFHSKAEQETYMKREGLDLYCAGQDSGISDSQHSTFHQGDTPAPTARAAKLAEQTFFAEQDFINTLGL